jgi:hypothetical protein
METYRRCARALKNSGSSGRLFLRRMPPLFDLLSGRSQSIAAGEWHALLAIAKTHGVEPLFAQRVLSSDARESLPADVDAELRAIQEETTRRNMRRMHDFATVVTELQLRGIPVIALKGMHLVPLIYRSLAARAMIDIDLLVPAVKLAAAGQALQELGYAPLRAYRVSDDRIPYSAHHLPPFVKSDASTVEVHWHISVPPSEDLAIVDEFWTRAVPARIAGVDALVLSTEDLLLHLAVHATYNHRCEVSIRACCDIAEIVRAVAVDWDALIERATRWNIGAGTYLVLRLARELLDAPIPEHVLAALAPRDFDPRLLQIALRGTVESSRAGRLRHARGVLGKLRAAKDLVFVGRDQLADAHNVPRSSPLVYTLYLRRAARLAGRWREVVAAHRGDGRVAAESAAIDALLRRTAR